MTPVEGLDIQTSTPDLITDHDGQNRGGSSRDARDGTGLGSGSGSGLDRFGFGSGPGPVGAQQSDDDKEQNL